MARFLHTADWQLDMGFTGKGDQAAALRRVRLETVGRLLELARTEATDFVLVAGDVFEHNQVRRALLYELKEVLRRSPCPVYLLPGNHDPLEGDSIYLVRDEWKELPAGVHVLREAVPVRAAGATLYPCPCRSRVSSADPTAWIPAREEGDGIRIGVAHGSWQVLPNLPADDHPIPPDAGDRGDLDYLALGHWHSTFPTPEPGRGQRVFYSGTPETATFDERDSGNALLVTIDRPGVPPVVERRQVGQYRWLEQSYSFGDEALVQALASSLQAVADPGHTLLRLKLRGVVRPAVRQRLASRLEEARARFFRVETEEASLRTTVEAADLARLPSPLLRRVAERVQRARGTPEDVTRRALELLFAHAGEVGEP